MSMPGSTVNVPLTEIRSADPAVHSSNPISVSIRLDFGCKGTKISQDMQEKSAEKCHIR